MHSVNISQINHSYRGWVTQRKASEVLKYGLELSLEEQKSRQKEREMATRVNKQYILTILKKIQSKKTVSKI